MKKLLIIVILFASCNNKNNYQIDDSHVEELAKNFMENIVIPKMKDPKPYEVTGSKVIIRRVADKINDYRYQYDHLSFSSFDSAENKQRLDSVIRVSKDPEAIINITVDVAYKTKYKRGDIVTDSIKLGYDPVKDKISYFPF
jgi:hypothetical protein